jgi:hypothetical protein
MRHRRNFARLAALCWSGRRAEPRPQADTPRKQAWLALNSRALGRKVSDEFAVPLCRTHHREVHRSGNEAALWATYNLDALKAAAAVWAQTPLAPHLPPAHERLRSWSGS